MMQPHLRHLVIAENLIHLNAADEVLHPILSCFYPNYQTDGPAVDSLHLRRTVLRFESERGNNPAAPQSSSRWYLKDGRASEDLVLLDRINLSGRLERVEADEVHANWKIYLGNPIELNTPLRITLAFAFSFQNRLLLHSSGVVRNDRLWIFCGASESGKSTVAEGLNAGGEPFCLDRTVLGVTADGRVIAYPTPFSDFDNRLHPQSSRVIERIFFLDQSQAHRIEPLPCSETGRRLLQQTQLVPGGTECNRSILDIAGNIAEHLQGYRLLFKKDPGFWELLEQLP